MTTDVTHPPRKMQRMGYDGPMTLSKYQKLQWLRQQMEKNGISLPLPTGN